MALKPRLGDDGAKIYRTALGVRVIASILLPCFLLMLILGIYTFWLPAVLDRNLFGIVVSTVLFVIGPIFAFWWIWQGVFINQLIVTADGIEFCGAGAHGRVDWNDLEVFDLYRYGRSIAWGVRLADDTSFEFSPLNRIFGAKWGFNKFLPLSLWQHARYLGWRKHQVDLEAFKKTPLGQDLLHYAPHLFEDVE